MYTNALSINGYYLKPTLAYKASTIFGGDGSVRQGMRDALGMFGAQDAAGNAVSAVSAVSAAAATAGLSNNALAAVLGVSGAAPPTFADYLRAGVASVNNLQLESDDLANRFAAGLTDNIHEVMIASEKADIALQFATAIRSKALDAYQEIMRMQL
jgi:flagellar hook-basal body complex protein FliE